VLHANGVDADDDVPEREAAPRPGEALQPGGGSGAPLGHLEHDHALEPEPAFELLQRVDAAKPMPAEPPLLLKIMVFMPMS